ncbi:MAG: CPCC family cysteine-rich protein, partial [Bradymonadaceae bacterium]
MTQNKESCPCCGHLTLKERGAFEICPVCFWEGDGQDDIHAHLDYGGPNCGTLWQARANFLKFG